MARYLKRGMDASAIKAADAKVRETVETILAEVEARRDAAVRELSQKFDNWSPPSFKLTAPEIERAISQLGKRDLDDMVDRACRISFKEGFARAGQRIIIVAGVPLRTPGATNMVRIAFVGGSAADEV